MSDLEDPRVLFAAERTALAWNRTALALMAFGFVIERFGLFLHYVMEQQPGALQRGGSYWIGLLFILLGTVAALGSALQYRIALRTLDAKEVPPRYPVNAAALANVLVAIMGLVLLAYLFVS